MMTPKPFELTTVGYYGAQTQRVEIDRAEALNRLIDRGVVLDRAVSLIDALPCGIGVTFHDAEGLKSTILRLR